VVYICIKLLQIPLRHVGVTDRKRFVTDGWTDLLTDRQTGGQCDYYMPPFVGIIKIKSKCEELFELSHQIKSVEVLGSFQIRRIPSVCTVY